MNIRTKVRFSFILIILVLLVLGIISVIITYQIKENSNFRENISRILLMEEGMSDILAESTKVTDSHVLEKFKADFLAYEKKFERLKEELSPKKRWHLAEMVIQNLRENTSIRQNLNALYRNEQSIELTYDENFALENEKFDRQEYFNTLYPQENALRAHIQELIFARNNVEEIKVLGNIRYYSKETLYQQRDSERLKKWEDAIHLLITLLKPSDVELKKVLLSYAQIVQDVGKEAIRLEEILRIEHENMHKVSNILKENKDLSISLGNSIATSSGKFIQRMRWIQFILVCSAVIFVFIVAWKVNRNVSFTMNEVEVKIEEGLQEVIALNTEIEATQKEIIFTMGTIGESRSQETGNHVKRVAEYSTILAVHYGLSEEEVHMLKLASPMHDIGKVAIPDAILNKPGRFDDAEREIMNTHALLGYEMLCHSQRPLLKMAAIVAKEHHEKYDGTGYPEHKEGEDIHIYGRITALADVFDALGSDRVYKPAWEDDKIFALFKEERGKHFDPRLVDIFFEHLDEFLHVRKSLKD